MLGRMDQHDRHGAGSPADFAKRATPRRVPAIVWFCLAFYALAIVNGVRSAVVVQRSAGDLVFDAGFAICLYSWVAGDARRRREPIYWSLRLWYFAFAVLLVPGYVIATRGWKGAGWVVFHALGWVILGTLSMIVTMIACFALQR